MAPEMTICIRPDSKEPWGEIRIGLESVDLPYGVADRLLRVVLPHVKHEISQAVKESAKEAEKEAVRDAIESHKTYVAAAKALGISDRGLRYMRKRYGL